MTMNDGEPSVVKASNTVAGFPEISYFHTEYFDKTVSPANKDTFADVKLYADDSIPESNYFNLFELTASDGGDPD